MLSYIIQFWQIALVLLIVVLELLSRLVDRNTTTKNKFEFEKMPLLRPVRIPTAGNGAAKALWIWISATRKWEVSEDFYFTLNGIRYVIPTGFVCDCTSIPKFLRLVVSPTGILLVGALIHDYTYAYGHLKLANSGITKQYSQRHTDRLFRDINIQVNGFTSINYIAYYILRTLGFFTWYTHRGRNKNESLKKNV